MSALLAIVTFVVAAAAAVRSTWSPCGRSMLSTITPIGERGRRSHYATTAAFFVLGGVLGGAALGLVAAGLAAGVAALGLPIPVTAAAAVVASLAAAASDARPVRFAVPIHRRQVNERWLDTFRPWFYGLGFGCQIGSGFATYITTTAVYLVVVLAVLTGSPAVALAAGVLFGLLRGSSVLLARRVTDPEALRALHLRLHRLDPSAARGVVRVEVAAALTVLAAAWWPAALLAAAVVVTVWLCSVGARGTLFRRQRDPRRATTVLR
ncbi:MAG TPA: hypothetical protein VNC61_02345 [Acidimicrobiales bacterium]|nr:hypothetical protein [Acidimicrobiales bacterium]